MIAREPALVISFQTGTDATAAERYTKREKIPARLIPLPTQISAGCGLALKAPPDLEASLPMRLTHAGVRWDTARVISI